MGHRLDCSFLLQRGIVRPGDPTLPCIFLFGALLAVRAKSRPVLLIPTPGHFNLPAKNTHAHARSPARTKGFSSPRPEEESPSVRPAGNVPSFLVGAFVRRRLHAGGPGRRRADPDPSRCCRGILRRRQCRWSVPSLRRHVSAVVLLVVAPVVLLQQYPQEHQRALAPAPAPHPARRQPRRRRRILLVLVPFASPAAVLAAHVLFPVLLVRRPLRFQQLDLHSSPRLQHRRSPGDERIIAGAVGRQLRPRRRRRPVLAEGRAIQRRGAQGAGGEISPETPPAELHQKDHLRVQEVAGRQPAEGEGPVREERRGGGGDRRPGGVRQQLRLLRVQRAQQPEHRQQPLPRPAAYQGRQRLQRRRRSVRRSRRQWRLVVAGARGGGAAAGRLRRRRGALGHPRRHAVREPGLVVGDRRHGWVGGAVSGFWWGPSSGAPDGGKH